MPFVVGLRVACEIEGLAMGVHGALGRTLRMAADVDEQHLMSAGGGGGASGRDERPIDAPIVARARLAMPPNTGIRPGSRPNPSLSLAGQRDFPNERYDHPRLLFHWICRKSRAGQ